MSPSLTPGAERRRRPSTVGGLVYLILVGLTIAGLCLVAFGPWRRGIALVGASFVVASGARLLLDEGEAGMLRVRSRWFDVTALAGVGVALIVLAANVPDQPGL
ncbi:MAG: DUF3017 domain-containing protein [Marmoricola sp.]